MIWYAVTKMEIAHFSWCIPFQGFPLGSRLCHLGGLDPHYAFYGQQYWAWIQDIFNTF